MALIYIILQDETTLSQSLFQKKNSHGRERYGERRVHAYGTLIHMCGCNRTDFERTWS